MTRVVEETPEEKKARYMAMDKEKLVDMLMNCHKVIDSMTPIVTNEKTVVSIGEVTPEEFAKRK